MIYWCCTKLRVMFLNKHRLLRSEAEQQNVHRGRSPTLLSTRDLVALFSLCSWLFPSVLFNCLCFNCT